MNFIKINYALFLIIIFIGDYAFSTNFYTQAGGDGLFGSDNNWVGAPAGRPGNNFGYANSTGPANDTLFINHPLSTSSDFAFDGVYVVVVIGSGGSLNINTTKSLSLKNGSTLIVDGGTMTVTRDFTTTNPCPITIKNNGTVNVNGNMTMTGGTLTIEEGSTLNVDGSFTTNNTAPTVNINGGMMVGAGMVGVGGTWNVGATGNLDVIGNLTNNVTATDFNIDGNVSVSGNTGFFGGTFDISSTGSYTGSGTYLQIGGATITNDGMMNFPNMNNLDGWNGGGFDCDGATGTGSVGFGAGAYCGPACNGGEARCVDNGQPLPIELNYFNVSIEDELFVFSWETLTEENNDFFTVEYSLDLSDFESVLEEQGAGTSLSPIRYERATAVFPFENIIYFRLKQTDFDGQYSYSKIEALNNSALKTVGLSIYPNPTKGKTLIQLDQANETPLTALVLSPSTLQMVHTFQIENGEAVVDLTDVEDGVYFLKVENLAVWFKLVVQNGN